MMSKTRFLFSSLFAFFVSVSLIACGGGGGSDDPASGSQGGSGSSAVSEVSNVVDMLLTGDTSGKTAGILSGPGGGMVFFTDGGGVSAEVNRVAVADRNGNVTNLYVNGDGTVVSSVSSTATEVEPNDTRETAVVVSDNVSVSGSMQTEFPGSTAVDMEDWFSFTATLDGDYEVRVDAVNHSAFPLDHFVDVYHGTSLLARESAADIHGGGQSQIMTLALSSLTAGESYQVKVFTSQINRDFGYSLIITPSIASGSRTRSRTAARYGMGEELHQTLIEEAIDGVNQFVQDSLDEVVAPARPIAEQFKQALEANKINSESLTDRVNRYVVEETLNCVSDVVGCIDSFKQSIGDGDELIDSEPPATQHIEPADLQVVASDDSTVEYDDLAGFAMTPMNGAPPLDVRVSTDRLNFDGAGLAFEWEYSGGPMDVLPTVFGSGSSAGITLREEGTYTITLKTSSNRGNGQLGVLSRQVTVTATPPAAPSGLSCSPSGPDSSSLSWGAVSGASVYRIYHSETGVPNTTIPYAETSSTSFSATGLDDAEHRWIVSAVIGEGDNAQETRASNQANCQTGVTVSSDVTCYRATTTSGHYVGRVREYCYDGDGFNHGYFIEIFGPNGSSSGYYPNVMYRHDKLDHGCWLGSEALPDYDTPAAIVTSSTCVPGVDGTYTICSSFNGIDSCNDLANSWRTLACSLPNEVCEEVEPRFSID